ncbi:hypothetical protein HDV00_005564 [Rhizophlyctis rosea]|nr:hypothetical protein HDV00_005564 [Rhizophlyctis rosea]
MTSGHWAVARWWMDSGLFLELDSECEETFVERFGDRVTLAEYWPYRMKYARKAYIGTGGDAEPKPRLWMDEDDEGNGSAQDHIEDAEESEVDSIDSDEGIGGEGS